MRHRHAPERQAAGADTLINGTTALVLSAVVNLAIERREAKDRE